MTMKLYDVPRKSYVRIIAKDKTPVDSPEAPKGDILFFYRIDGMYSYCKNSDGEVVHPAAWTEVEILDELGNVIS